MPLSRCSLSRCSLSRCYYLLHGAIKPIPDSPYFYDRCFSMAVLEITGDPLSRAITAAA